MHTKLANKDGMRLINECVAKPSELALSYITNNLQGYIADGQRNYQNAQLFLKRLTTEEIAVQGPAGFIEATNYFLAAHNAHLEKTEAINTMRLFRPLKVSDKRYLPAAFMHVSSLCRSEYTPYYIRAAQVEEDIMHMEIVAMLIHGSYMTCEPSYADIAFRFSDAAPERLEDVKTAIDQGISLTDALGAVFDIANDRGYGDIVVDL